MNIKLSADSTIFKRYLWPVLTNETGVLNAKLNFDSNDSLYSQQNNHANKNNKTKTFSKEKCEIFYRNIQIITCPGKTKKCLL